MQRSVMFLATSLLMMLSAVYAASAVGCGGTKEGSGFVTPDAAAGMTDATMALFDGPMLGMQGDGPTPTPGCMGMQCQSQIDSCESNGKSPTTITGTVYDPAGALPLYNVYVYIPNGTPLAIAPGNPTCTACQAPASGSPVIGTLTDAKGNFTLQQGTTDKWGVPSGADIPLVIQVGKWRRQIKIPTVTKCTANAIPNPASPAQRLRLPAKSSEGDMPMMAFTSGCDPAECFLRHIGIADSEFVPPTSTTGHVHFYTGQSGSQIPGGNQAAQTYQWWSSEANLLKYDIIFNACECSENDRGPAAYPAMHSYLSAGGRLFTTHYYFNWFTPPDGSGGYVSDFNGVVNWMPNGFGGTGMGYFIDTTFPKGKAFADWMQDNKITQTYGSVNLVDTRNDMGTSKPESSRWIYNGNSPTDPAYSEMYMSFNTPVGKPPASQCGRAVFSDVHLSGSSDTTPFPQECAGADPTGMYSTNEKALEFLFFDLSSCVQDNSQPPPPPMNQ
jgi:hypothetical protein